MMGDFRVRIKPTVAEPNEGEEDRRPRLVRVPRGADSSIFGGWGVRI